MNDELTCYCAELCGVESDSRDYWIDQECPERDDAEPATEERLANLRERFAALENEHRLLALFAKAFLALNGAADERHGSQHGYHLSKLRQFLCDGLAPWQWSYESQFAADLAALRAEAAVAAEPSSLAAETAKPFVPNTFQHAILGALDGRALKVQQLANEICGGDHTRLYKKDGIKELKEADLVILKRRLGYYRPDAPPSQGSGN